MVLTKRISTIGMDVLNSIFVIVKTAPKITRLARDDFKIIN